MNEQIKKLVEKYPNDMELGEPDRDWETAFISSPVGL